MMGVVTCTEDLEYIDTSLRGQVWLRRRQTSNADKIEVGSNGNRVRDDSVLETQKFSSISAANLGQTTAALYLNRNLITPDSTVPCNDQQCPIRIPHNIGRFYNDGERADSPCDADYETPSGIRMVPASHYFHYTKPPPDIIEAYIRLAEGNARTEDLDNVRRYKMNHCYSPIISECPSPASDTELVSIPCLVFDPKKYDAKHQEWLFETLENNIDEGIEDLVELKKANRTYEKTGSQENATYKVPTCLHCDHLPVQPRSFQSISTFEELDDEKFSEQGTLRHCEQNSNLREMRRRHKREKLLPVPKGERLKEVQLSIQERVINEIAEKAYQESQANNMADTQSQPTSSWQTILTGSTRSSLANTAGDAICLTIGGSEGIDRKLEVHAALSRRLKVLLVESSFQSVSLLDKNGSELEIEAKFECMSNVLLIVRHGFRQLLGDLNRAYRPSGIDITNEELEILFEEHLTTFEMLVEKYPSMRTRYHQ